ncbi:hypothetical protein [Kamptonema formosum]|nr:hypothetical protein [Kamptonema formosum]
MGGEGGEGEDGNRIKDSSNDGIRTIFVTPPSGRYFYHRDGGVTRSLRQS